jgi:quercetin dioxygenase-like cupin family protein
MDSAAFEAALRKDGFEVETKQVPWREPSVEHDHPFEVRALVLGGEIMLTKEGTPHTYRAGEVFSMPAGCRHSEAYGAAGLHYILGRRQAG